MDFEAIEFVEHETGGYLVMSSSETVGVSTNSEITTDESDEMCSSSEVAAGTIATNITPSTEHELEVDDSEIEIGADGAEHTEEKQQNIATSLHESDQHSDASILQECHVKVEVDNNNEIGEDEKENDADKKSIIIKKSYKCEECQKRFTRKFDVKRHMLSHTQTRQYKCSICVKTFLHSNDLKNHQYVHTTEQRYGCDFCGKKFKMLKRMQRHVKNVHSKLTFECEYCHKTFKSNDSLNMHMRGHTGDNLYKCDTCGRFFLQKSHLKDHQFTHLGKLFTCDKCDCAFGTAAILKRHQILHVREKKNPKVFQCDNCKKTFTRSTGLTKHKSRCRERNDEIVTNRIKVMHECHICGKQFTHADALQRHGIVHLTPTPMDKPHTCQECCKSFTRATHLRRHELIHQRKLP